MMTTYIAFAINVLLVTAALLLAITTLAVLRFHRLLEKSTDMLAALSSTAPEVPRDETECVEKRIAALQKIADELSQNEAMLPRKNMHDTPYENAVRMAQRGAGIDELTRNCGLRKGEAELLVRLHASRTDALPVHSH